MPISNFFIDRPIFASVISIITMIVGFISYVALPVAQFPEVAPPTVQVSATYPGASADTVAKTVATPIEQEINGVEGMIYMQSQAVDGQVTTTISFAQGTNIDDAQVLVQNRVARAEPRLPEPVRRLGVVTQKSSPDFLMVIHLLSPDETYDQLYVSNYATLQVRDRLSRVDGVGQVLVFGARDYAMRIWIDPHKAAELDLSVGDIVRSLRAQNVQVASGTLGQSPIADPSAFQLAVQTQGRLTAPEEFGNIIIRSDGEDSLVRVRDVARVELGAQDYNTNAYLDNQPAVAMAIFQRPGSNALTTAGEVLELIEDLSGDFPPGLEYQVIYNPTEFVDQSVKAVYRTLFEATLLVVLVVFIFLQSVRAAMIPVIAIPVSLIGTFAIMNAFGFSLNTLSLFGLVLAIGIVVDDAIVVVENVERNLEQGKSPREATRDSMAEIGGALIATSLVLCAVFVPTAFIPGLSGAFYRQFALTIAASTVISTIVSLTLSPAMATLLLRPKEEGESNRPAFLKPLDEFFGWFNRGFDRLSSTYADWVCRVVRRGLIAGAVYGVLLLATVGVFRAVPGGFVPAQDQGYLITVVNLPQGASLQRTDEIVQKVTALGLEVEGVEHAAQFAGFNGATFTNASNAGAIFFTMSDFGTRPGYLDIQNELQQKLAGAIDEAFVLVIAPPPIRGIGNGSGFKMMVQDRTGAGLPALQQAAFSLMMAANEDPDLRNVITFFETSTPQIYLDIDRQKAELMGLPVSNVFEALEGYLGSSFINDFNYLGRTYRVTAQADDVFRRDVDDISAYYARNAQGEMVPVGAVAEAERTTGASRVLRFNLYPSAAVQGEPVIGVSSGEAIARMEALAEEVLPPGFGFEWTEIAYQQTSAGNTGSLAFVLAVVFVFLFLAAQYESLTLPLAVILIVPMGLLSAMVGVMVAGQANTILTQIGLVVLIGLATKNAVLIVEFAKQLQEREGMSRYAAATEAAKIRLRPVLMTAFSFILGVLPLVLASGAGAEMRNVLGVAVFAGMLGVTLFGLFLTPVFYVFAAWIEEKMEGRGKDKELDSSTQMGAAE
ncbi:efflux RND transporter permease subunit [Parvularcula maris]|uniref:Efflux pump membrane transporter n=1 Tax=Parvularcula maris TaxID=2965077 RepID=A0A9X2L7H1_9PROT|nr:efflux RND transporter permease subunit [Parvularcula maris]